MEAMAETGKRIKKFQRLEHQNFCLRKLKVVAILVSIRRQLDDNISLKNYGIEIKIQLA